MESQMPLHMPSQVAISSLLEKPRRVSKPKSWIGTPPISPLNPSMVKYREYLYRLAKYQKYLVDLENYKNSVVVAEIAISKQFILHIANELNATLSRKRKQRDF